jgi:hypothetical protein
VQPATQQDPTPQSTTLEPPFPVTQTSSAKEAQDMGFSIKAVIIDIEGSEKTFVSFLVKEYAEFYKNEPTLIQTVDTVVSYTEDGLAIVLPLAGEGALAGPIDAIVEEAVTDLNRASALVYDFGPSPTAASIFAAVQSNLVALETAGHITNPATIAKLKLIINAIGTVAQLIAKAVAAATPSA